jgi:hypothetical protein
MAEGAGQLVDGRAPGREVREHDHNKPYDDDPRESGGPEIHMAPIDE